MFLSNKSVDRPIMMTMFILTFVVFGLFSFSELSIDLFPEVEFPYVTVQTIYPGAGPYEIESLITKKIEEEVSSIEAIKNVMSSSAEGFSLVILEFELGTDVDVAANNVKDKVNAIVAELPEDAYDPTILKFDMGAMPILDIAVVSNRPLQDVYVMAKDIVKEELGKVTGVASIDIVGGKEREILVSVKRDRLNAYNLPINSIISSIAGGNIDLPSGRILGQQKELNIRLEGEFETVADIRDMKVSLYGGSPIPITDLAEVIDTFKEQRDLARLNDASVVGLSIVKRSDANVVDVAADIKRRMESLKKSLPSDVKLEIAQDRSEFITESISGLSQNMVIGICLTALVLFLFLHTLQATFIVAIVMPVAIISTFTFMRFAGFTINMMSLMALAISIGVLVTNSIVVLENIYRYLDEGLSPKDASKKGTSEIAIAVLASALTNIAVFTPIAFMSGIIGQFFLQFGLTVTFATIFSLITALTLTPLMASKLLKPVTTSSGFERKGLYARFCDAWEKFYDDLANSYKNGLSWVLGHRIITIGVILLLLFGVFFLTSMGLLGFDFMPASDEGTFSIQLKLPPGYNLEQTDKTMKRAEKLIRDLPDVEKFYTTVGKMSSGGFGMTTEGVHLGEITVDLIGTETRSLTTAQMISKIRNELAKSIPAAEIAVRPIQSMGGGGGADIELEITGPEMDKIVELSDEIVGKISTLPVLVNVKSNWESGKPELKVIPNREKIAHFPTMVVGVAAALRASIEGSIATKYRVGNDEFDVRVRFSDTDKSDPEDVKRIMLNMGDYIIPVSAIADVEYGIGPVQINRKNKKRFVTVQADILNTDAVTAITMMTEKLNEINFPEGYNFYFAGEEEMRQESMMELNKALLMAIILTFMILAAILESYIHPITIAVTLPLALIGVLTALMITARPIEIFSMMAIIMLVGIVVNNGILIIDYIRVLREQGKGLVEAIVEASQTKLRPIIMSNIAISFAMIPMAIGGGSGGEINASMGVVSIGGILSSTVFTLILIPILYYSIENRKLKKAARKHPAS